MLSVLELQLPPSEGAPAVARRRVVERFAGELDDRALEDARLLTSELVTNAVVHGRGTIELSALVNDERLIVEVADQGNGFERVIGRRDLDAVGGNGLTIVERIASRWGIREGRSHVWFELERLGRRSARPDLELVVGDAGGLGIAAAAAARGGPFGSREPPVLN